MIRKIQRTIRNSNCGRKNTPVGTNKERGKQIDKGSEYEETIKEADKTGKEQGS